MRAKCALGEALSTSVRPHFADVHPQLPPFAAMKSTFGSKGLHSKRPCPGHWGPPAPQRRRTKGAELFDLIPPRRHDAPTFNGCSSATPEDRCTMPVLPSDPGATNGGAPKSRQAVRSSLRPGLY